MAILSGRYGQVKYDPTGAGGVTAVEIVSINNFKMSQKTDRIDVTCFGDVNRVYVPGMKAVEGSFTGFHNAAELTLWEAVDAATPGHLFLSPNRNEAVAWSGLAYLDAEIDTGVNDAPAITGTFSAAGPWTMDTTLVA